MSEQQRNQGGRKPEAKPEKKDAAPASPQQVLTEKFVPGQTKCRIQGCGHKVMVRNTSKKRLDEHQLLIERSVKCQGPGRHTYTIPEIVKIK